MALQKVGKGTAEKVSSDDFRKLLWTV